MRSIALVAICAGSIFLNQVMAIENVDRFVSERVSDGVASLHSGRIEEALHRTLDQRDQDVLESVRTRSDIQTLDLRFNDVPLSLFSDLGIFENITSVDFAGNLFKDSDLKYLARFPNLQYLNLDSDRDDNANLISGEGFRDLAEFLPRLERLEMSGHPLSVAGAQAIGNFRLKYLALRCNNSGEISSDAVIALLDQTPLSSTLERLVLSSCKLSMSLFKGLPVFERMKVLVFSDNLVADQDLQNLTRFPNLEELNLATVWSDSTHHISGAGLSGLAEALPNLRKLNLSGYPISHAEAIVLGQLHLTELALKCGKPGDISPEVVVEILNQASLMGTLRLLQVAKCGFPKEFTAGMREKFPGLRLLWADPFDFE